MSAFMVLNFGSAWLGLVRCPHCERSTLMYAPDVRCACDCGRLMIDLGEPLETFVGRSLVVPCRAA